MLLTMNPAEFSAFRDLIYRACGIHLREGKEALVAARIAKRVRDLELDGPSAYLGYLRADRGGEEMVRFIDLISTNFTSFYREKDHFAVLHREAREWIQKKSRRVRVWCAAASTGEEPYTIAITLAEALDGHAIDYRILATDISTRVLAIAKAGFYSEQHLLPVPPAIRQKYFDKQVQDGAQASYAAGRKLRDRLVFARLNLATPPFPMRGPFDAILCRNVMIYFDQEVRDRLVAQFCRLLAPGGLLIVGHSETLSGMRADLETLSPSVYRRRDAA
jgi:chemotaxis protein methyltransferase CheR